VVDFVRDLSAKTELPQARVMSWVGIARGKFFDWRLRYGRANEHNALVPRDHWIEGWERRAIIDYFDRHPLEGYRRLTFGALLLLSRGHGRALRLRGAQGVTMSQKTAMPLAAAYEFAEANGLEAEAGKIRGLSVDPRLKREDEQVRKGHLLRLFASHGLMDRFIAEHWPAGLNAGGWKKQQYYRRRREKNDALGREPPASEDGDDPTISFGLEAQLRDFIAHRMKKGSPIGEQTLRLYTDAGGRDGVEYPTDVGPIDILAQDPDGGRGF
jgi:hypothetical protein